MITAQDIREKTFERAKIGGYEMAGVDDFLEEMAADVASSQKELGSMRAKMAVLAKKIEEYRSTEGDMQKALVSAQTTARRVEEEAKEKAEALLSEAQNRAAEILAAAHAEAAAVTGDLVGKREEEERRLDAARKASAAYIEKMLSVCAKQSGFLTTLKDMEMTAAPAVEEEEAEEEIVPETVEEETVPDYVQEFETAVMELEDEEEEAIPEEEEQVDEPTRMFRF